MLIGELVHHVEAGEKSDDEKEVEEEKTYSGVLLHPIEPPENIK